MFYFYSLVIFVEVGWQTDAFNRFYIYRGRGDLLNFFLVGKRNLNRILFYLYVDKFFLEF